MRNRIPPLRALLVGGDANLPALRPWEGCTKVWHNSLFVLEKLGNVWRAAGRLPHPAGHGLSVAMLEGVLLIGGGDASEIFTRVLLARWYGQMVANKNLPPVPMPLAMHTGALLGRIVYVVGGLEQPNATAARKAFLALDLDHPAASWRDLEQARVPTGWFYEDKS